MSKYLILAAAAAAGGLASGPALAGTQLGIQLSGAGQATPIGMPSTALKTGFTFPTAPGAFGTFPINRVTAIDPSGVGTNLGSITLNAVTNAAVAKAGTTITITVSETSIPSPAVATTFTANFTENFLPDGWTVTETAIYNTANSTGVMGKDAHIIGKAVDFAEAGSDTETATAQAGDFRLKEYALIELYTITLAANASIGQDLSTINIMSAPAGDPPGNSSTVPAVPGAPEPSTWVMMGLGFAGLGLAGWNGRKSRASAAARLG
jgi:hypothetical protein